MGVVDAAFNDGGRHQYIKLASCEILHHVLERLFGHLSMRDTNARLWCRRMHPIDRLIDCPDAIAHVIHLSITRKFEANGSRNDVGVPLSHMHLHRHALIWRREDKAHIAHTRDCHLHRARNWRSGER